VGENTRSLYDDLAGLYLPVAVAVLVVVFGATAAALLGARRRRRDGRAPSERSGAPLAESLYVVALVAVSVLLVAAAFRTQSRVDAATARPGVPVAVTAAKWRWRFDYGGGRASYGVLVVPAGRAVRFTARSVDVLHDFWVPDVRFQRQVWPDTTTAWTLTFPAGVHEGVCAWFCGLRHDAMRFEVRALPPARFAAWRRGGQRA
jgi:cytochrome c oxidase subunit 2